jgi:opacity protein-like surface antigen
MKKKLLVASLLALAGTGVMAQSAFQGFYGQLGTGYEGNTFSSLNSTGTLAGQPNETWAAGNQNANGLPLVVGLGFNVAVSPSWLLGLGADYSALKQKSSNYNTTGADANTRGQTLNGSNLETSNRFNIFLSPGYVINKDKLAYLKAGYSSVTIAQTMPNQVGPAPFTNLGWSSANPTSTASGYILGLGYKQIISNGLYGFVEGNYMSYGSTNFSATGTTVNVNRGYTLSNSPNLKTMQLLVGVGYKF